MPFVIKATLKDETRRLSFDVVKFPPYGEVQRKVSSFTIQVWVVLLGIAHPVSQRGDGLSRRGEAIRV